jgi:hypothetical protein
VEAPIAVVFFEVAMIGGRRAFAMILAGAVIVLEGCQAVLGIDPSSRHEESAFCAAVVAYDTRCNVNDACDVARLAACANNEAIASRGAISAYTACAPLVPCPGTDSGTDAGSAYVDCLASNYGAPSTLLTTLVESYCTQCGAENLPQCTTGLIAQSLATFDDAILAETRDKCFATNAGKEDGGTGESCANFSTCMNDIVTAADPPPAACNGK